MNIWGPLVVLVLIVIETLADQQILNSYIRHYEGLDYSSRELQDSHHRARRSTSNPHVTLKFEAHGRSFNLRMRRDTTTFTQDVTQMLPRGRGEVPLDTSHIYEGHIWGEEGSYVHGSIIEGVFTGRIHSLRGIYFVERTDQHFKYPVPFHSIIYHEKDVIDDPFKYQRESHQGNCGHDKAREWMDRVVNSAVPKQDTPKPANQDKNYEEQETAHMYKEGSNIKVERLKRSMHDDQKTCTLFLQSDPMLWNHYTDREGGLAYSHERTREEITSLFASHVVGIKKIYEDTTFTTYDGSLSYSGISFNVRRVKIMETDEECANNNLEKLCEPNIDVSNFLNEHSLQEHNDFCLAYMFTWRDFTGGTLGLAWVGSPTRASGGICEEWKEYQENNNRIFKSLNTGIVTLINYNSPVPPKVSTLTFAHEVGHNFGSPHDQGDVCTPFSAHPSDPEGNYIMYASATSGDRPNNSHFSSCSKDNITRVLDAVFHGRYDKRNCFVERLSKFCGNNIVEESEECDCGYQEDCQDACCHGRGDPKQCQRKTGARCSPSEGPCCNTTTCQYIEENKEVCISAADCNEAATCNGLTAQCPTPTPKENNTVCNHDTKVCISGECVGSVCQRINWEQCFLTAPDNDPNFDKATLCYVACFDPTSEAKECVSTGDPAALEKPENSDLSTLLISLGQESIQLQPGAPCNDLRGYCDVFKKCRDVDADGPLARLKKLLFNEKTFTDIRDWIIKYWWGVLLMGVGLIGIMGLFIRVCAVHTPSSNPNKKAARKLTLRPQHRHQGPPPPYSGPSRGGPPHGKGRGPQGRGRSYEMQPQKL